MSKSKYQIGTKVKIINPEFFVRCGYPETMESAREKLEEWFSNEHSMNLCKFLQGNFPFLSNNFQINIMDFDSIETDQIINILTRVYNKNILNFGGKERKIFTKYVPELKDEIGCIQHFDKPLIRKTGIYDRGGKYSTMDGVEYEPPTLEKVKTHVFYPIGYSSFSYFHELGDDNWLEKTNFEIIEEED